jgi:hypothetical protein
MDSDGFTVNFTNATSANNAQVVSLALAGLNAKVGSFNKATGAATATQAITGVNFKPALAMFTSVQDVTQAAPQAHSRFGLGASDGTTEGSAFQDERRRGRQRGGHRQGQRSSRSTTRPRRSTPKRTSTTTLTASRSTDDQRRGRDRNPYLAMGPMAVTEVRLTSFDAAVRQRRAAQWKTGYEFDNLGFNVYREIDGVRTKVNTSIIAGSALQAGQGGVAERPYARWDRAADSLNPTVTYWLEDIELNGTSKFHGPISPVVNELADLSTSDSDELGALGDEINARRIFFSNSDDPAHAGAGASAPVPPPEVATQWNLAAAAGAVKIGVRKPGWYRVTQPELLTAGLASNVDPRTLQLFVDGTELAIRVTGETDGHFDAIEFYGSGVDTPYTDTRTYWLRASADPGQRIAVDASGALPPSASTGFRRCCAAGIAASIPRGPETARPRTGSGRSYRAARPS